MPRNSRFELTHGKYMLPCWILVGLTACVSLQAATPDSASKPDHATIDNDEPLRRIAFGSCFDQNLPSLAIVPFRPHHDIWDTIADAAPDLMILLGDNIYAKTEDMNTMRREYAKLATNRGYQRLRRSVPILATWDDNDYGRSDVGAEYPKKKESRQIFLDFFDEPMDSPRRAHEGVYDAKVIGPPGQRTQIILLDTRYFRGPLTRRPADQPAPPDRRGPYVPTTDTSTTMLGDTQWTWLAEQLRVPVDLRIIVSSIQLISEEHGYEKWANFPHERDRLFRLIADCKTQGTIVISGDRHAAELSRMDAGIGYPLYDLTSSSLNKPRVWAKESNRHRLGETFFGANFGMINIDWDRSDRQVCLQILDSNGKVVIDHEIDLSALRSTVQTEPRP